ncbi:hypothetical protein LUZ60_005986 [Juncus effusus]|nr:hypothetical protein LUZ60_005986 [Juncus effusus]
MNRKIPKGKQIEGEIHAPFTYIPSPLKSFSCELGPKFGIQKSPIKSRSFTDLTELLQHLDSKFDDAKEKVNIELLKLTKDLKESIDKGSLSGFESSAKDLLALSKDCISMTSSVFRDNCEKIVRDLAMQRERGEVKSLLLEKFKTRVLFVLTRCTRLLQFGEDNWNADGESFERFQRCLESVPAVDMKWVNANNLEGYIYSTDTPPNQTLSPFSKSLLQNLPSSPKAPKYLVKQQSLPTYNNKRHVNEVICRICEENVPASHLESHSYVCAYANECDNEGVGVDERLIKVADMLEQIVEAYGADFENQSVDSSMRSSVDSPQLQEWHNKGTEGMFEDIHVLDTSRIIEESYFASSNTFKSLLAMKLNGGGSFNSSPNHDGSMTSASSTPRASHFDLFWIGHNNPSDHEDIDQVHRLAYVTRKVAHVDCESETASQALLANLHDLIDILTMNQIKGLVIDTFGYRIKKLLKKKYLKVTQNANKRRVNKQTQNNETNKTKGDFDLTFPLEEEKQAHNSISSESERISIDDFEKMKEISRGAFGKVFLAKKRTTGDLFAIKVLKKLDMIRKNDIERILAERDILIAVRNPFVVRFFYSFTCRENLYLVMEYLNGGDLYSLLKTVGCLDEKNARIYIAELVLALEYLHSLGIIHRDLKPDNILIAGNGHIKLTDFGLSKIGLIASSFNCNSSPARSDDSSTTNDSSFSGKRLKTRSAVGTPDYLAPEILLGTEHGCAADWWSVGVILFELITGIPPFTARSPEMIFDNILNRRIPWPDVPNEISVEAQDLIDRLLTHDEYLRLGARGASEVINNNNYFYISIYS